MDGWDIEPVGRIETLRALIAIAAGQFFGDHLGLVGDQEVRRQVAEARTART